MELHFSLSLVCYYYEQHHLTVENPMPSIFSDKKLLKQAYISRLKDMLSDIDKIREAIKSRYGKEIDIETLKQAAVDEKVLNQFVEDKNIARVKNFFGSATVADLRDQRISKFDRFLLDSLNFEIWAALITDLVNDYPKNEQAINRAWQKELDANKDSEAPPLDLLTSLLKLYSPEIFKDLIFDDVQKDNLFSLQSNEDGSTVSLRIRFPSFEDWLYPERNLTIIPFEEERDEGSQFLERAFGVLFGTLVGAAVGIAFSPLGILAGAIIGMFIAIAMTFIADKLDELVVKSQSPAQDALGQGQASIPSPGKSAAPPAPHYGSFFDSAEKEALKGDKASDVVDDQTKKFQ